MLGNIIDITINIVYKVKILRSMYYFNLIYLDNKLKQVINRKYKKQKKND